MFSDSNDQLLIVGATGGMILAHITFAPSLALRLEKVASKAAGPHGLCHFVRLSDHAFAALYNRDLECVVLDAEAAFGPQKVPVTRRRITAISSADGLLSLSSDDGRTRVFARAGGRLMERFSIPTYRSAVVCSCISPEFGVVVSGTSDGALVVGTLADGSTVRVVRLPFVPVRVAVTPAWGFVVVHGTEVVGGRPRGVIAVYTINGLLVRSVAFRPAVECWTVWASERGFDFMVIAADRGKLWVFEVFWLDLGMPAYRCGAEVVALEFSRRANVVVAVSSDGALHIVPFTADTVEKYAA
jgi:hypothetical protein